MQCPICFIGIHADWQGFTTGDVTSENHRYQLQKMQCPECRNDLVRFWIVLGNTNDGVDREGFLIPLVKKQKPLSDLVPKKYADLYIESSIVLPYSPRASAALSRTCLQGLLREYGKVTHGRLFDEIKQIINADSLPSRLAELLDVIRTIGNDATHPNKYQTTGEIIPVEKKEAEWGLEILNELFDHYIIKPDLQGKKLEAFRKKSKK